jgi:hypothetical protein
LQDFLRVTELIYHPADAPGTGLDADEFEFLELKNISTSTTLDLTQARLTQGVQFDFATGAVASLAPGEFVLVVSNPTAFASRYGSGFPIAGEYSGQLNNAGERVRIEDTNGVAILDFVYDDQGEGWYPQTDGDGYSLVIRNEMADADTWSAAASWRPSYTIGGSPAADDTATLEGDVNGDLRVDLVDVAILQANYGIATGALRSQGDLNGDGAVGRSDAALLARNFGRSLVVESPAPAAFAPSAVVASSVVAQTRSAAEAPNRDIAARPRAVRRMARSAMASTPAPQSVDRALEASDVLSVSRRSVRRR